MVLYNGGSRYCLDFCFLIIICGDFVILEDYLNVGFYQLNI